LKLRQVNTSLAAKELLRYTCYYDKPSSGGYHNRCLACFGKPFKEKLEAVGAKADIQWVSRQ